MTLLAWACLVMAIVAMLIYHCLWAMVLRQEKGRQLWKPKRSY